MTRGRRVEQRLPQPVDQTLLERTAAGCDDQRGDEPEIGELPRAVWSRALASNA
jgi:hypothetical protein